MPTSTVEERAAREKKRKEWASQKRILEAMANQKNIIASNVAGIRDQLAKFKEHMFEAGNEIELINKLKYFMNCSVDTNNRLGKVFYDYVVNYHDISIERNKLQQYYQLLLEE